MKKIILLFALFYLGISNAQSTAIEWQKSLGGSSYEEAKCIQSTPDGGYIMAGNTGSTDVNLSGIHSANNSDGWVVKLSSTGTIEWQKCIGGSAFDIFNSIQPTSDGGYIAVGYTDSNNGDVSGNHSASSIGYYPPDHNFIDSTDAWVVKLSSTGTIEWQKCLGGTGTDEAKSVQLIAQGGYIITGYTTSNDGDVSNHRPNVHETTNYPWDTYDISPDAWVVKLTSSGAIVWEKCLDTGNIDNVIFNDEYGESIQPTVDGGFIMSGGARLRGPDNSMYYYATPWVVKIDSTGNQQWDYFGIECTIDGKFKSIELTSDGGYIMAGYACSDLYVVKLNSMGTQLWVKYFGGSSYEGANSIKPTIDGGYILAGETSSNNNRDVTVNHGSYDAWILRLNSVGNLLWQKCLGGTGFDQASSIAIAPDGGYIMAGCNTSSNGDVAGNNGSKDAWVVKLVSDLPPTSTSSQTFCQGATVASLVATGEALRWYTVATGGTALASTALLTSRTYYVSQTVSGVESLRVPVTVTVNVLPTSPLAITGTAAQGALVGTTTTATYSIAAVAGVSSYFWTPPTGAYIVSGQGTTSVSVNFKDVPAGIGKIGNIMVQTVNDSGCKSVAKTLMLTKALPAAPSTLKMTIGSATTAITSFAKYMGTNTVLKLTASTVAAATSYEWELPEGVNRTDASGTNSILPYIYVNFLGVTNLNTFNYITSTGVSTNVLRIGVKAKNGVGVSVSNNAALINPITTSSAKQLTLTAVRPAAVSAVTGITAGLCGLITNYNYTITASALASGYTIMAPAGSKVTSVSNPTNSLNTLTTSDLIFTVTYPSGFTIDAATTTANKSITITAVNGIGNSATNRVITLSTALGSIGANTNSYFPANGVVSRDYFTKCAIQRLSIPLVPNATSYEWTLQNGATGERNTINSIDIDFSAVPTLTATTKNIVKVKAYNGCTYSAEKSIILYWDGITVCGTAKMTDSTITSTLTIYPNPTSSILFIESSNNSIIENLIVTDLLGKVIFEGKPENNQLNVERFASGAYIIQVFSGEEKFTKKFIKE